MFKKQFLQKYKAKNDCEAFLVFDEGMSIGDLYDIGHQIKIQAAELIKKNQEQEDQKKPEEQEEEKLEEQKEGE